MAIAEALELLGVENTKAIKSVETIIGGISQIFSIASTASTLLNFIGLLSAHDPFDEINKKLDDITRRIEDLKNTVYDVARVVVDIHGMIEISTQMGPVVTVLDIAKDYIEEQSGRNKERLENALIDAQTAINIMIVDPMNNGYFRRLYHQQLVYQQWDGEDLKPPNISSGQVWNHQYVLPFILRAIAMYLTASGIAEPDIKNYRRRYGNELCSWAENLQQIHDEIGKQIVSIRTPNSVELWTTQEDHGPIVTSTGVPFDRYRHLSAPYITFKSDEHGNLIGSKWYVGSTSYNGGQVYGALETYSGHAGLFHWEPMKVPFTDDRIVPCFYGAHGDRTYVIQRNPPPPPEGHFSSFYAKHAVATMKATKDLYQSLGLLSVSRIIGEIRAIAGLVPIPPHPMSYWSLRQVDNVVGLAKFGRPSTASTGNQISVRTIADALGIAPPFSLRNSVLAQP